MITLKPADLEQKQRYKLLVGSVVPRPIALVTTVGSNGEQNVAPFSFFTVVCTSPMMLAFFPQRYKQGSELKDTTKNLFQTGECVVNVVTEIMAETVNKTSGLYAYGESEFDISELTPIKSMQVKPPRVKESPLQMECLLSKHIVLGDEVGGTDAMFLEVVAFHIEESLFDDFRIDYEKMKPVARLAGVDWAGLGSLFQLNRP